MRAKTSLVLHYRYMETYSIVDRLVHVCSRLTVSRGYCTCPADLGLVLHARRRREEDLERTPVLFIVSQHMQVIVSQPFLHVSHRKGINVHRVEDELTISHIPRQQSLTGTSPVYQPEPSLKGGAREP